MIKKISLLLSVLLISSPTFAMFCPNNFNQINIGDSIEQVTAQCRKPDSQTSTNQEPNVPQEWVYYVTQTTTATGPQASVKMVVALIEGKVVNITVNDMSLASTGLCGGTISTGQTPEEVKQSCGEPAIVNKTQQPSSIPATKITEFKYNTSPPVTLVFENGSLKERK